MSRKCAIPQCESPGVLYLKKGVYYCERHGEEKRLELAAATAMAHPVSQAELDHHTAQLANSASLEAVFPELRDPTVLAQQIAYWREIERSEEQ